MFRGNTGLALALLAGLGWVAPGEGYPTQTPTTEDERIEHSVREALAAGGFAGRDVRVQVRGGVVFLAGSVADAREKLRVIEAAFAVADVEAVESELEVLRGVTPLLEEVVWRELILENLDRFVSEVLVRDGVATVRGEAPDVETRERIIAASRRGEGISSVQDELIVPAGVAEHETRSSPAPPEPPVVEAPPVAGAVERTPPAEAEPSASGSPGGEDRIETLPSSPANLAQQVAYAILTYSGYTVFDHVQFSLENGDVVLIGAVTGPAKKRELEERVRAVHEVARLTNEIQVLPESKDDERLREKLFRRIYEDELFAPFAEDSNPPIHILVEGGLVTLTGVVDETIEKMSAEAIVRNVFEVTLVRNRIRVRKK